MPIYVDDTFTWPAKHTAPAARRHGHRWCHLWCDPGEEAALHTLAQGIGLLRSWYQTANPRFPHYDLVPAKRKLAIDHGATPIRLHDWIRTR
jgi:hypothetical protein